MSTASQLADAYFAQGNQLFSAQRYGEAQKAFQLAIEAKADMFSAHLCLSLVHTRLGNQEAALEHYEQAITINPSIAKPEEHVQLANCHLALGLADKAILGYKRAISLDATCPEFHARLADAYLVQENLQAAAETYLKAILINPDNLEFYYRILIFASLFNVGLDALAAIWEEIYEGDPLILIKVFESASYAARACGAYSDCVKLAERFSRTRRNYAKKTHLDELGLFFIHQQHVKGFGGIAWIPLQIRLRMLGWIKSKLVLLGDPNQSANPALLNYLTPFMTVISDPKFVQPLASSLGTVLKREMAHLTLDDGRSVRDEHIIVEVDRRWRAEGRPPLLQLADADKKRGWDCLEKLGVPRGAWLVTAHLRQDNGQRITSRSVDPTAYFPAFRSIVRAGGWVIRIGDRTMTPLPKMDGVVDYVFSQHHSDWMDVFLWSQCRFYLGVVSGPCCIPREFGVPSALTNCTPMMFRPTFYKDVFIPKMFWHVSERRYLSLEEILTKVSSTEDQGVFAWRQLAFHDNSPEDLCDVVDEMCERIAGTAQYTREDEELQNRFQKMCEAHGSLGEARVGRAFLRKYASILF